MNRGGRLATSCTAPVGAALVVCLALWWPQFAAAQWLNDLHRTALQLDPAVNGAQAQVKAAEARLYQARAAFGPTAVATLSKSDTRYREAPAFDLRPFTAKQAVLQITQPLLKNALFPALDSAQAQFDQAQSALDQARAEATVRLVEACFDVMKARDSLVLVGAQLAAAEEQLVAARKSFKVGTVSITDVREAEAKIDTVLAQRIAAEADVELKLQLLQDLAGRPVPEVSSRTMAQQNMPAVAPASMIEWLADAQMQNAQIRQAQLALTSAEAEINKAWQGHSPTADLTYSYTMSSDTGTVTSIFPRRGDTSQIGVNVNIPLFASGATQSKVTETMALRDKAQSDLDAARRSVQTLVRQNFSASVTATAQARGLETANRSLEVAFVANRRGYEIGVKTNGDVLEAQSRLFEARRDLLKARHDAWLSYLKLKAIAGRFSPSDIESLDVILVPVEGSAVRGRPPLRGATP